MAGEVCDLAWRLMPPVRRFQRGRKSDRKCSGKAGVFKERLDGMGEVGTNEQANVRPA